MTRWIIESGLKLQRIILAVALGVVAVAVVQVGRTPLDLLPEYQPPLVEVQTEALGLSAAEVEQLITVPLEQDLLVGVPFLEDITSVSLPGLSSVMMTFEPGTEVLDARQVVQERLTQAVGVAGLPAVAKTPQMMQPRSSNSRVAMVKLTSESLSPVEMSVLARWVISPRLMGVPGVANVSVWGNRERQLQVLVDPERLRANGVTLPAVVRTAGNALEVSPLSYLEASKPGTGGFIDTANQRLNIFHEQPISDATELAQVPLDVSGGVTGNGADRPVALGDVTDVVEDHQPLIGDTTCSQGSDCLILVVEKFPSAHTVQVDEDVDEALETLAPGLADIRIDSGVYRPADYLESSFSNLGWALLAGGVLLVVVLLVLLRDWRRTAVVIAVVATSTAAAILVLDARDTTVNLLMVAGLVTGLSMVILQAVHDTAASVDTADGGPGAVGVSAQRTGVDRLAALRRAAFFATLIIAAALLPLFFLPGEGGAFIPPVAASYLLAVVVSLVVAFVLTPALCVVLLRRERREAPVEGWVQRSYDRSAAAIAGHTAPALGVAGALALAGLVTLPFLNFTARPELEERDVLVRVEAEPGTSLPRMTAIAAQAVEDLRAVPGVDDANAQIGRAVMSDRASDVNEAEVWLSLEADTDFDATLTAVRDTAAGFEGVTTQVGTYTDYRATELLEEDRSDVAVRVYGDDPEVLTAKADEVRSVITGVEGVQGADTASPPRSEALQVVVDLERAQARGVKPGDVRRAAAMLVGGVTVGHLFQEQKVFDVVVWGAPEIRRSAGDLRQMLIDTPDGGTIRLADVAAVEKLQDDAVIAHQDVTRYVDVTARVEGRDVGEVNDDVAAAVAGVEFPLDHHAEVLDASTEERTVAGQLVTVSLVSALVVLLLLQSAFRSWRLAVLALVALPLCLVGGLAGTLVTGGRVTPGVLAGLLAVVGVAVHTVVSSVAHLVSLVRRDQVAWNRDLVVRGTRERLLPTLTSMLAIAAVFLPLALAVGRTGLELLGPAALTLVGGLLTTTAVTVLVVPALALRVGVGTDQESWMDELFDVTPAATPATAPAADRVEARWQS